MLHEQNTVFAQSGTLYATGLSLGTPQSSMQTASYRFSRFCRAHYIQFFHTYIQTNLYSAKIVEKKFFRGAVALDDRPTNRPTDHATRSVTIGGAHRGEAKFSYYLPKAMYRFGRVLDLPRERLSLSRL